MPASTIWLKTGNTDVRVYKQKVGNALMIKEPVLQKQFDDKPVRDERVIAKCHWEQVGTGEILTAETILKDKEGKPVDMSKTICILENFKSYVLNEKAEAVDKKQIQFFLMNPDGSIGSQVAPYPPTERIEVKDVPQEATESGDAYWVPATVIENFLINEAYELPAADPRNDSKLFKDAEDANKRDEIAITTYSNGGFKLYYAFLVPFFKEGKFVWLLKVSDKQVEYRCLRDIPAPTTAIREVKTISALPPIQNLLTVPTQKKKN